MSHIRTVWAIVRPDGSLVADTEWDSAATAWRVVLGWPTSTEVRAAVTQGWRAVQATVSWPEALPRLADPGLGRGFPDVT